MANCVKCGAPLEEGAKFCGVCGATQDVQPAGNTNTYTANNTYQQPNNSYSAYQQQQPPVNNYAPGYNNGYQNGYQNNGYQFKATLPTNRNWVAMLFLTIITLGIYGLVWWTKFTNDANTICDQHDGKHSTHYLLMVFIITGLTLGIGMIVWEHNLCKRLGNELKIRGINYEFGAGTYWLWNVLGSLIIVGPFVFMHKLTKTMNLVCENYNRLG